MGDLVFRWRRLRTIFVLSELHGKVDALNFINHWRPRWGGHVAYEWLGIPMKMLTNKFH